MFEVLLQVYGLFFIFIRVIAGHNILGVHATPFRMVKEFSRSRHFLSGLCKRVSSIDTTPFLFHWVSGLDWSNSSLLLFSSSVSQLYSVRKRFIELWSDSSTRFEEIPATVLFSFVIKPVMYCWNLRSWRKEKTSLKESPNCFTTFGNSIIGNINSGKWDDRKYYIISNSERVFEIYEDYVTIEGLQVYNNRTINHVYGISVIDQTEGIVNINQCIVKIEGSSDVTYNNGNIFCWHANNVNITNCVIYGGDKINYKRTGVFGTDTTVHIFNCIISGACIGIQRYQIGSINVINSVVFNNIDNFLGGDIVVTYSASDDGDGTNAINMSALSDDWSDVFVDYDNYDFHLKKSSVLIDNGTNLSSKFTDDIDGETRTGTWDVGADEYNASYQYTVVTLESPADNYAIAETSITFNCSASDNSNLKNITLWGDWSGWHTNETVNISGTSNSTTFTKTLAEGNYVWNCIAYDNDSNSNWGDNNYTLTVDATMPNVTSISALPNPQGLGENITITATVTDNLEVQTVLVGITPPGGSEVNYTMINQSSIYTYNYLNYTNGIYNYTIYAKDISNNLNDSGTGSFELYSDVYLHIKTLKDTYGANEIVNITDPFEFDLSGIVVGEVDDVVEEKIVDNREAKEVDRDEISVISKIFNSMSVFFRELFNPSDILDAAIDDSDKKNSIVTGMVVENQNLKVQAGNTYYMATDGSDTTGDGSSENEWQTLQYSMAHMSGGDTLIIRDGVYTGVSNMVDSIHYPFDGSVDNYTILKAENDGQVIFDGEDVRGMFNLGGSFDNHISYVQFEGIIYRNSHAGLVGIGYVDHIRLLRCGAYDAVGMGEHTGDSFSVSGGSYVLFEDCYAWGAGRKNFYIAKGSEKVIVRRCVVRHDRHDGWHDQDSFMAYDASQVEFQNCISIDGDQGDYYTNQYGNPEQPRGYCIRNTAEGMDLDDIYIRGCMNIGCEDMTGTVGSYQSLGTETKIINFVHWGSNHGSWMRGNGAYFNHCTMAGGNTTDSMNVACYHEQSDGEIMNSIFYGTGNNFGIRCPGDTNIDYNCLYNHSLNYLGVTPGSHDYSSENLNEINPLANSLKYLPRIETGSDLDNAASDGGDIGATIIYKIGRDGTLWGEEGYNETTNESLWPFPNEDIIKEKMKAYSYDDGSGGEPEITGNRGFAADGTGLYGGNITLTSYIWEYLGNSCPSEICNYGNQSDEYHKADTNHDSLIDMPELMAFIARWKANDGVSKAEVEDARNMWFSGGGY